MNEDLESNALRIVEGKFDGENMWGEDNRIYPIPPNYCSKSKLVEGDRLKLYLQKDGRFVFKQIVLVPRKRLLGYFTADMHIKSEEQLYKVISSAVRFHKARAGDQAVIIVPVDGHPTWAALDNVVPAHVDKELDP